VCVWLRQMSAVSGSDFAAVGQATRELVLLSINNYTAFFSKFFSFAEARALAMQRYWPSIELFAPEQAEELKQLAVGAGVDLEDVVCLNARTELLAFGKRRGEDKKREGASECTTVVRGHLLAQTWDWMAVQREAVVILDVQTPRTSRVVTLSEGGLLCKMGMNEHGLAVTLNLLESTADGWNGSGIPIHILLRIVLSRARSTREALALVRSLPVDASSCLTFLDSAKHLAIVEISPSGVFVRDDHPSDTEVHTNHFVLAPHVQLPGPSLSNSQLRFDMATRGIEKDQELTPLSLRRILSIHSDNTNAPCDCICKHSETEVATIAVLVFDTSTRCAHICPTRPCSVQPFTVLQL
jgi:isopenicillin-N N-acyltransferase-like protein